VVVLLGTANGKVPFVVAIGQRAEDQALLVRGE
jgi:hypothetical protein